MERETTTGGTNVSAEKNREGSGEGYDEDESKGNQAR